MRERLAELAAALGMDKIKVDDREEFYLIRRRPSTGKQVFTRQFDPRSGRIVLVPIGDLHVGSILANRPYFEEFCRYILKTPDCYTILMGDQAENATRTSVGLGIWEEDMHLPEQKKYVRSVLKPLAEAGKILGIHTGNHEFRTAVLIKENPMEDLADQLGVPYLGYQAYHRLVVGKVSYHVFSGHGIGTARTRGGQINAAERPASIFHGDLYLTAHTHARSVTDSVVYEIDDATDRLVPRIRHFVVCGSFLEYWGGYAEQSLLSPQLMGAVRIELYADRKEIRVIS